MSDDAKKKDELIEANLLRLAECLPRRELKKIISESNECEELLKADIALLEQTLQQGDFSVEKGSALEVVTESVLTPLERYWTASALLGRLRGDLAVERIPTGHILLPPTKGPPPKEDPQALLDLESVPLYTKPHENTHALLSLYKKVSSHRSAAPFKKPVRDEEAPGYSERIVFPIDLSLIRKMIVSRQIKTYKEFHRYIGLISHNCLTFNGRETDYGFIAREFEMAADDAIRHAVLAIPRKTPTPTAAASAAAFVAAAAPKAPAPRPDSSASNKK